MSTTICPVGLAASRVLGWRTQQMTSIFESYSTVQFSFFCNSITTMSFNGNEGTDILPDVAHAMTKRYRTSHPDEVQSIFFGRKILEQILQQDGCMGIRFYYGLSDGADSPLHLVAAGADANEDDQLGSGYIIADDGPTGPPRTGGPNILNS